MFRAEELVKEDLRGQTSSWAIPLFLEGVNARKRRLTALVSPDPFSSSEVERRFALDSLPIALFCAAPIDEETA